MYKKLKLLIFFYLLPITNILCNTLSIIRKKNYLSETVVIKILLNLFQCQLKTSMSMDYDKVNQIIVHKFFVLNSLLYF